jgi:hypothetical protein
MCVQDGRFAPKQAATTSWLGPFGPGFVDAFVEKV